MQNVICTPSQNKPFFFKVYLSFQPTSYISNIFLILFCCQGLVPIYILIALQLCKQPRPQHNFRLPLIAKRCVRGEVALAAVFKLCTQLSYESCFKLFFWPNYLMSNFLTHGTGLFLYLLITSENFCFRGYKKMPVVWDGLMHFKNGRIIKKGIRPNFLAEKAFPITTIGFIGNEILSMTNSNMVFTNLRNCCFFVKLHQMLLIEIDVQNLAF